MFDVSKSQRGLSKSLNVFSGAASGNFQSLCCLAFIKIVSEAKKEELLHFMCRYGILGHGRLHPTVSSARHFYGR
jgi:hypothetical protein